jgi:metal-responsive CopG/Arc/MetJ family transcriptional regulator
MKTAVSIPDNLFRQSEETARELGIPRSQLVARALEEFIYRHKTDHLVERLNAVYGNSESSELDASVESLRELTKHDTW